MPVYIYVYLTLPRAVAPLFFAGATQQLEAQAKFGAASSFSPPLSQMRLGSSVSCGENRHPAGGSIDQPWPCASGMSREWGGAGPVSL